MALPSFLQGYLWSYDVKKLDKKLHKETIITSILDLGDVKAISWLFKNYSLDQIKSVLKNPRRGVWHKTSLLYWQRIFDVKAEKLKQDLAYINIDPNANINLYKKLFRI